MDCDHGIHIICRVGVANDSKQTVCVSAFIQSGVSLLICLGWKLRPRSGPASCRSCSGNSLAKLLTTRLWDLKRETTYRRTQLTANGFK